MAFEDPPPDGFGENVPMPFILQVIAVILALTSLGIWLYMVTS